MKQPRFFCENCKREVSVRDKVCPGCGKFFSDVRCPKCGFTGRGSLFQAGCPKCGYLNPALQDIEILEPGTFEIQPAREPDRNSLPPWFFMAVTLGLAIILSVLVYFYITL